MLKLFLTPVSPLAEVLNFLAPHQWLLEAPIPCAVKLAVSIRLNTVWEPLSRKLELLRQGRVTSVICLEASDSVNH